MCCAGAVIDMYLNCHIFQSHLSSLLTSNLSFFRRYITSYDTLVINIKLSYAKNYAYFVWHWMTSLEIRHYANCLTNLQSNFEKTKHFSQYYSDLHQWYKYIQAKMCRNAKLRKCQTKERQAISGDRKQGKECSILWFSGSLPIYITRYLSFHNVYGIKHIWHVLSTYVQSIALYWQ